MARTKEQMIEGLKICIDHEQRKMKVIQNSMQKEGCKKRIDLFTEVVTYLEEVVDWKA